MANLIPASSGILPKIDSIDSIPRNADYVMQTSISIESMESLLSKETDSRGGSAELIRSRETDSPYGSAESIRSRETDSRYGSAESIRSNGSKEENISISTYPPDILPLSEGKGVKINYLDQERSKFLRRMTDQTRHATKLIFYHLKSSPNMSSLASSQLSFEQISTLRVLSKNLIVAMNPLLQFFQLSRFLIEEDSPPLAHLQRKSSGSQLQKMLKKNDILTPLTNENSEQSDYTKQIIQECRNIFSLCCSNSSPSFSKSNVKREIREDWSIEDISHLKKSSINIIGHTNRLLEGIKGEPISLVEKATHSAKFFDKILRKKSSPVLNCIFESQDNIDAWKKIKDKIESYLKSNWLINLDKFLTSKTNRAILQQLLPTGKSLIETIDALSSEEELARKEENSNKQWEAKKSRLRVELQLLESYRDVILQTGSTNSEEETKHLNLLDELRSVIVRHRVNDPALINILLKEILQSWNVYYIETLLQTKLEAIGKELLRDWKDLKGNAYPYSYKDLEDSHWERLSSAPPMRLIAEWKRSLYGYFIWFLNQHGKVLLAPPVRPDYEENELEKMQRIEKYIPEVERIVSEYVFGDKTGTLLENFRSKVDEMLKKLVQKEFIGNATVESKCNQETILDIHERIFTAFAPFLTQMTEGMTPDGDFEKIIKEIEETLLKTNSEVMQQLNVLTIATYLLAFYRCLYQEFMTGTLTVLCSVYKHIYPDDTFGIKSLNQWADDKITRIEIKLEGGVTFKWLKRRQLCNEHCLFNQDLTIEVPPIHSQQTRGNVFQSFNYRILPGISKEQEQQVRGCLRKIAFLLKIMDFPSKALLKEKDSNEGEKFN